MPTSAGGLTFYDDQFETGLWWGLTQYLEGFNQNSGGAIILEGGARKGRKPVNTVFDTISGLVQRRNPSGTSTLTPSGVANFEHRAIKIFRSAPVKFTRQDWIDLGMNTEDGTQLYGEQFGQAQAQDFLNSAIAALTGAINAIGSTATLDVTGDTTKTLTHSAINNLMNKLGDRRQSVATLVAHSAPMGDLINTAFSQQTIAFQVGPTTIFNGMIPAMGLRTVVTDAPGLLIDATSASGSVANYNTLALVPNAIQIKGGPSGQVFAPITGDGATTPENQQFLLSIEWEFELAIKGVSYKSASGDNPNAASLATSSNWELVASDRKLGPGALLLSQ